ncbi:MAG: HAMP domain-containing sensor histidine kinase [Nitrospirota bacterium]|nr:HAMP domain-containing sensor histidine kinase [Nitrospirota bacterium]
MKPAMLERGPQSTSLEDLWAPRDTTYPTDVLSRYLGPFCLGLAVLIFYFDQIVPTSIPVHGLYVCVVYLTTRLSWPGYFWIGVYGCTGLILIDLVLAIPNFDSNTAVASGGISLLTLWLVAWVCWKGTHEKSILNAREHELEARLQELTGQLGAARVKFETSLLKRQEADRALANLNQTLIRQNQELETILSVTSHDLRSPLVNVQGFGKELAKACVSLRAICEQEMSDSQKQAMISIVDQDIPEALHYIQAGTKKMETLLQGVLRLGRLGRLTLRNEQLDMNEMMAGIVAGMEYQLKEKEVTLQINDLPRCVGDVTLINQLFCNLLDNACKYLDPSRPGIIQIYGIRNGEWATYTVKDNGMGIHTEHQDKIFQLFYRLNPSAIRGDGLGLTIVKRIIDRHHGIIKLESFPGTGTSFTISLAAGY